MALSGTFRWLSAPPLAALLGALDAGGEEARVVGGAVRDALLGAPVKEVDLATTALPELVRQRCEALGWKVIPTGIEHGTVTVVVAGRPFEVTTLREDIATDGRHAIVRFGRSFEQDAMRRDFTINALSLSRDGRLHDNVGGLADIRARRVRFVGDADRRIAEDYLRILRLFRCHALYGEGPLDPESLAAAVRGRGGLARISRERVRAEMLKLLAAPAPSSVVVAMSDSEFLQIILGGIGRLATLARLVALESRRGLGADPLRRLAGLAAELREDAERLAGQLRLSRAEARRLAKLAQAGEVLRLPPDARTARRLAYAYGADIVRDAMLVAAARSGDDGWQVVLDGAARLNVPARPFRGRDVAARGILAGPRVGEILARAEALWIAADFPESPQARAAILDAAIRETA